MSKLLSFLIGPPGKPRRVFFAGLLASATGGVLWADRFNRQESERTQKNPTRREGAKADLPATILESAGLWAGLYGAFCLGKTQSAIARATAGGAALGTVGILYEEIGKVFSESPRCPHPKDSISESGAFGAVGAVLGLGTSSAGWLLSRLPRKS